MDGSDIKVITKGQLISKLLFVVFNSSKNERKQVHLRFHSTANRSIFFVRFLEEFRIPTSSFEIS